MSSSAGEKGRFVVLAAVDDSNAAEEVLRAGANLARSHAGGELHLVHVIEHLPPPASLVPPPAGLGLTTKEIVSSARKRREQFAGRLSTHVAAGSASKQILQLAIDLQADLILVGTHGRSGIKRMLVGS